MLRLVSDENFNGDIVRGLLLRHPALDLRRVQDVGLVKIPAASCGAFRDHQTNAVAHFAGFSGSGYTDE